jgi:hypothetical protein
LHESAVVDKKDLSFFSRYGLQDDSVHNCQVEESAPEILLSMESITIAWGADSRRSSNFLSPCFRGVIPRMAAAARMLQDSGVALRHEWPVPECISLSGTPELLPAPTITDPSQADNPGKYSSAVAENTQAVSAPRKETQP